MNRAHLERVAGYQPKPGIAAAPASAFSLAGWLVLVCVACGLVVWPTMFLVNGCSPSALPPVETQVDVAGGVDLYRSQIHDCLVKASDGGTFRSFQQCACDVDRVFQIDASSAGAECR